MTRETMIDSIARAPAGLTSSSWGSSINSFCT